MVVAPADEIVATLPRLVRTLAELWRGDAFCDPALDKDWKIATRGVEPYELWPCLAERTEEGAKELLLGLRTIRRLWERGQIWLDGPVSLFLSNDGRDRRDLSVRRVACVRVRAREGKRSASVSTGLQPAICHPAIKSNSSAICVRE